MHVVPPPDALRGKEARLAARLGELGSVLVGFSGGVDSAYLGVFARRVLGRERVLAAIGVSESLDAELHRRARELAAAHDVPYREVRTRELDDPGYVANVGDRCFHCKRELWARLGALAESLGLAAVADGTIVDDFAEHRPGSAAGARAGVVSPLADAEFTKRDVRDAARRLGLPNWDAPAAPCLASRIATGVVVSPARLERVGRAERALRALGVTGDLRVRDLGESARVEIAASQLNAWSSPASRRAIVDAVAATGFAQVAFDERGYRRGALQEAETGGSGSGRDTLARAEA